MTQIPREWKMSPRDSSACRQLSGALGIRSQTAQILVNRGLRDVEEARSFLWPALSNLADPSGFRDMDAAVDRIKHALRRKEKILIHGDYDVDGVTATALLIRFFQEHHAEVDYYIPDRIGEGYGMHLESLKEFHSHGVNLILSVDNGITAYEEVEAARELGMDVIITDHHEPGDRLPDALAVINPKRRDATYPFRELAGVGVAFKLAWAIAQSLTPGPKVSAEMREFLKDALGLVALGTVADVVPLLNENRVFVRYGLRAMSTSRNPGLRALMAVCNLIGKKLDAYDLAFKLGPRVNAAGRLGDSNSGVRLLTSASYSEALELARTLERENRKRRAIEQEILGEALGTIEAESSDDESIIVLASEGWHVGVLGIVASKISDRYYRPCVLISIGDGKCKGSARSIPEFHIQKAFARCADRLVSFGGHAQAAGLVIQRDELDAFRRELGRIADEEMPDGKAVPSLSIDLETELADLDEGLVSEILGLSPFGSGNREPVLASRDLSVAGRPRRIGQEGKHLSFFARDESVSRRAVAFGRGDLCDPLTGKVVDLAFVPQINSWRGRESIELVVKDVKIHP
jgi:single-stranded-DNA-specific exonuclease